MILGIETATPTCSIALGSNGKVIASDSIYIDKSHSKILTTQIQNLIERSQTKMDQLEAVAISIGPGSYTGLRIGLSVAKGLCFALSIPIIGISTLLSMAYSAHQIIADDEALYAPLIDARRLDVYTAVYNSKLESIIYEQSIMLNPNSFQQSLDDKKVNFFGTATIKASELIQHSHAFFHANFMISADSLIPLATKKLDEKAFDSLAYLEPTYLKGVYTKTPVN